jgi:hypothetical protein
VREALKLRVVREGTSIGLVFLAHGHQGTLDSDRFAWLARPAVRYPWRWLQQRVGFRSVTPARDFELRAEHERAMFAWASGRKEDRFLLITGHTHRPVFMRLAPPGRSRSAADVESELELRRSDPSADREEVALLAAELELLKIADVRRSEDSHRELPLPTAPPCYFNTGACSFADGTVTGIELADGEIRLVRWQTGDAPATGAQPGDRPGGGELPPVAAREARPQRKVLEREDLFAVLQAVLEHPSD